MTDLFTRDGRKLAPVGTDAKGRPFAYTRRPCGRCGGEGRSDRWAHTGYTCFDCGGAGTHKAGPWRSPLYTAEQNTKMDATQAKAAATRNAKAHAARAAREEERRAAEEAGREARELRLAGIEASELHALLSAYADRSEFVASALAFYRAERLSEKHEALARDACDRFARQDALRETAHHVGTVGERITFTGEVAFCRELRAPTHWEPGRYLVKIALVDGASLTWFASRPLAVNARVTGSATVKAHDEFKGEPQTIIRNPRLKDAA